MSGRNTTWTAPPTRSRRRASVRVRMRQTTGRRRGRRQAASRARQVQRPRSRPARCFQALVPLDRACVERRTSTALKRTPDDRVATIAGAASAPSFGSSAGRHQCDRYNCGGHVDPPDLLVGVSRPTMEGAPSAAILQTCIASRAVLGGLRWPRPPLRGLEGRRRAGCWRRSKDRLWVVLAAQSKTLGDFIWRPVVSAKQVSGVGSVRRTRPGPTRCAVQRTSWRFNSRPGRTRECQPRVGRAPRVLRSDLRAASR